MSKGLTFWLRVSDINNFIEGVPSERMTKMSRNHKKVVAVFFAVVLLISVFTFTASASATTTTQTIELETRSALLIDKSGSMEKQQVVEAIMSQYDFASYDAVVNFDHRISTEDNFVGGGNSHICEVIDELADAGFTHITVITDGEQWPQDYSALSVYTDLDLTIDLVEEDEESQEFIDQLKSRLVNSNLKVEKPDGSEEIILNDYKVPIYSIEVPVVENTEDEGGKTFIQNIKEGYFPWWIVLLLAALIAALFDFIHELITRRGRNEDTGDNTVSTAVPVPKPIPTAAVAQIEKGAHVVADFSGSMAAQQSETAKACMDAQKGSEPVICFGDNVSEHAASELKGIRAAGRTHGWEALEAAALKGWDEIVLVSDLEFNGKVFDQNAFVKKFKKITVVTPSSFDWETFKNLGKIADEVEVLCL